MQATYDTAEVIVQEFSEGESVNAFELGYFLYFFRSAYVACTELVDGKDIDLRELSDITKDELKIILNNRVLDYWMADLEPDLDLEFLGISKNSPLKFVARTAGGCLAALTLAVILSGGKANVYTGKFELPPLAKGIRELKEAFGQPQPHSLPSERKLKVKSDFSKKDG